jgi:hypothetical protein
LATGHIVEDMKLGTDLALAGSPPWFDAHALVTSEFPTSEHGVRSQRTRWEHGHLQVLTSQVPRLLMLALRRRDPRALGLAIDLLVPPVAMLVLLTLLATLVAGAAAWFGAPAFAAGFGLTLLAALTGSVLLAWWHFGRDLVSLGEILRAPWYAIAKMPVYVRFFFERQSEWVRTRRRGE